MRQLKKMLWVILLSVFAWTPYYVSAQTIGDMKSNLDYLHMEYEEDVLDWLVNSDYEGPFHLVNQLKFRKVAEYPDDYTGERASTGVEANKLYVKSLLPLMGQVGNLSVIRNQVIGTVALVGNSEDWDMVTIVYYPSRESFVNLLSNMEYRKSGVHKHAALERTRAMITIPHGPIVDPTKPPVSKSEK